MRSWMFAAAAAVAALAQPARAEFKLGWAGPVTGGSAAVGVQNRNGVQQAVDDINAAGGIFGEKIAVHFEDDAGDPKQAVSVANRLMTDGIKFVIGHQNSGASIPASEVYNDAGALQITPASTNPKFTDRSLWNTFRTCGRDDQQGTVAGNYLLKHYTRKKVFIVHDKTPYGRGLADEVKKAINKDGLREVAFEGINVGEKDYSALASKIKGYGADVVYFGGVFTEGGLILRQMRDQGIQVPMIGGDAMYASEFASIAGPVGEGTLITFSPDARKNAAAAPVVARFKAKGIDPEGFTLYAYAAVQVVAGAIKAAGNADPKSVADKIHSGMTFDTVIGPLAYDKKGDITRLDFVFYRVENGRFQELPLQ
ncbi:branched-chain amino acid ABC transporter substrate-binding protein [Methylobacterium sp. NMS14P]|uniref:branched-chain amino acid ABC transporter substrate-binding protein n=1 Tax=Methylobacterium sp. NMS14P TaxID=2894310 RepID=UPI0023591921|nr:branched-chain amino acid ABC transporter substrate-binding protein [Methylobacterium sp. NMS14P]WCS25699.1 branched-chain amino acid ABC transporter substrate-binding protein [Methylobacterium sp. NMS14P]